MEDGIGGRYDSGGETNSSPAGLTLGGILSIKQTPSYRIRDRTLLDLIRDDQANANESKKTWKMLREKLRLRLAGAVCTTTGSTLGSQVHVNDDGDRTTTRNTSTTELISPPVNNASSVQETQTENVQIDQHEQPLAEEDVVAGGDEGEPTPVRMSLMSLLEVEGSAYTNEDVEVAVAEEGGAGDGGGGGGYKYNDCCVCMVRHKGAAFIPCGHTFCRLCSRELFVKRASCPLCNNFILEILDIF
ncbi:hypothetical protein R6Q59_026056 [Mikania micrantha]